jgi:dihydroorotate dehydrogenase (NAD+) catalytic subunit
MVVNLATDLAPRNPRELVLANPVLVASGTFGYGIEYARVMDIQRLGGIVSKGTTLRPRKGNPMPRIAETHAGMLNSIGLQNPGIHETIRKYCPIWERWQTKVLVNISGEHVDDYAEMARLLDESPGVAGIEVNISCPNVDVGGMQFGVDCVMAGEVTAAVRAHTTLPVLVKLSPNVTDIVAIAEAVVAAGADAITLINTLKGMRIDTKRRRPILTTGGGGLSGPAVKPVALWMTAQVAQAVAVPVVGIGGIATVDDALEFFMAGATAVQIGTASFVNPHAALDVLDGLGAWLDREGLDSLNEIIGVALPGPMPLRTAALSATDEADLLAMLRTDD